MSKINLYEMLSHLEKRPAMYLGNGFTFRSLENFLTGFCSGADSSQLETEEYNNFSNFNIWILGHLLEHFGASAGWAWQIGSRNPDNDKKAFEEFFYFLEIFKKDKVEKRNIGIEPVELEALQILTNRKEQIRKEIVSILQVTKYETSTTLWVKSMGHGDPIYDRWFVTEEEFQEEFDRKFKEIN